MSDERPPGLLAITGVGPAVARRLTEAGLGSLPLLAGASAGEVVARGAGWPFPPDLQQAQDWIDQARHLLAVRGADAVPQPRTGRPALSPLRIRHAFTLEVQADDGTDGTAVATRIVDVETQAYDTWSGWDTQRITRFVAARSGLALVAAESIPSPVAEFREAVLAFGIVDSPVVVPGGADVTVRLHVGGEDTAALPEAGTLEWDLSVGAAEGRATERLVRHRATLTPGTPFVASAQAVVPSRHARARLVAVVRILGPGDQPRLAHALTGARLDVVAGQRG